MSLEDTPTDALAPADARVIHTVCQRVPGVIAVYRFGSSVEGSLRADSDLDYAVLARRPLEPMERFELQEDLALALGRSVDLVDLRRASVVMRMQVIARARVLASYDPVEQERFEIAVYSSYARLNEERRDILTQIMEERSVFGR
jgi:predicted nucleotidyltransferase